MDVRKSNEPASLAGLQKNQEMDCDREVREARRGAPAGLLRRPAGGTPRNDKLYHYPDPGGVFTIGRTVPGEPRPLAKTRA